MLLSFSQIIHASLVSLGKQAYHHTSSMGTECKIGGRPLDYPMPELAKACKTLPLFSVHTEGQPVRGHI